MLKENRENKQEEKVWCEKKKIPITVKDFDYKVVGIFFCSWLCCVFEVYIHWCRVLLGVRMGLFIDYFTSFTLWRKLFHLYFFIDVTLQTTHRSKLNILWIHMGGWPLAYARNIECQSGLPFLNFDGSVPLTIQYL